MSQDFDAAALDALVRVWAHETATTAMRVNLFSPGPIRTKMRATVMPGEDPDTLETPEQVAAFALFLCRDEAKAITGANLSMDGGWTAV